MLPTHDETLLRQFRSHCIDILAGLRRRPEIIVTFGENNFVFLQVATVMAATDAKAAAFASNVLQQETLLNNNLRGQGLPEAKVLSSSYPEVC